MKSKQKIIKRNKKLDFKIWACSTYDNISGANYYYLITDYIKENCLTFKRFLSYNEALKWLQENYIN